MKSTILVILSLAMTVNAVARSGDKQEIEPFDRGIGTSSSVFIPAGTIGAGATFSYNTYSVGNSTGDTGYSMLLNLFQDVQGSYNTFGIAPHACYFFRDNLSVGAKFKYSKTDLVVDNMNLELGDDLSFSVDNYNYYKNGYTGSIFLRDYIPFGQSKRFAMFIELVASGSYAQAKSYKTGYDDVLAMTYKDGYYQDIYEFEISFVPGLIAFLTNEVALEVSIGLLGFNYQKVNQVSNQVDTSNMENSGVNFKINILTVNIGLSFYIPTGAHKAGK